MSIFEAIKNKVDQLDHVSFAELSKIDGFMGGTAGIGYETSNVFLWDGMTEEAVDALKKLVDRRNYHYAPANYLTYMVDGAHLNLPIAKSKRNYKKPHWLMAVICKGPEPEVFK